MKLLDSEIREEEKYLDEVESILNGQIEEMSLDVQIKPYITKLPEVDRGVSKLLQLCNSAVLNAYSAFGKCVILFAVVIPVVIAVVETACNI